MKRILALLAALWLTVAAAPAGTLTLVKQPTGAWIQHSEAYLISQFLYGAANPLTDNFYMIQWRHTLGDLPPWAPTACIYGTAPCYRTAHNNSQGVSDYVADQYVNASGYPTWRFAVSAMQMPCLSTLDGVTPNEIDGGLHSLNGSYNSYPQSDDASRAPLSTFTAMQWNFVAKVDNYTIGQPLVCAVNKIGPSVALTFSNTSNASPQTFIYDIRLRCDPAGCSTPHFSGTGPAYCQYDDSVSTYNLPSPAIGAAVTFNKDVAAQIKGLIQSNPCNFDTDLSHWYFSTSNYTEAAWGLTAVTTEFSFPGDVLTATTSP